MKKPLPSFLILCLTFFFTHHTLAQPGALDLSFNPGTGADGEILAIAVQPDNKVIAAGSFIVFDGDTVNRIVRLQPDGAVDVSFQTGTGANAAVNAVAVQADGKIVAGGDFTSFNGTTVTFLVRLNANGSIDPSFNIGTGPTGNIRTIAIQPDGKILVGGSFTSFNGSSCLRVARLHTNGAVDAGFNTSAGPNGNVGCMTVMPNGRIIIGGDFTIVGIIPSLRIACLNTDGSTYTGFNSFAGGASSAVHDIALQPDGLVMIGGAFVNYNAQPINYICRINGNGGRDPSYIIGTGTNGHVNAIKVLNNGYVFFGGGFSTYNPWSSNNIMFTDPWGTIYPYFTPGAGANARIGAMEVQPGNKLIIAGLFDSYDSIPRGRIARLYGCLTPRADSIYGNNYALCSGVQQTYYVTPVSGVTSYEWTLPDGWTGSSDSASITAISNGTGGVISVRTFSDTCGFSLPTIRAVNTIQPANVPICLVTVDSASTHNIIMWEKAPTMLIDSFIIYRETTSNVYSRVGAVDYDSLSEFHDYTANPNATSYRYKLAVLDTCGALSDLSIFHSTIHLQNLGNGNFQWTFYQIEPGNNPVTSFNVYRDNLGNGNFSQIGFVPGTNASFTDVNSSSFPNSIYVVDVNWGISCEPSRRVNTTRSNIRRITQIDTGIIAIGINREWLEDMEVFPNPTENLIHLRFPATVNIGRLILSNSVGQVVWSESPGIFTANAVKEIAITSLPKGIYTLTAETNTGRINRKIVIQ